MKTLVILSSIMGDASLSGKLAKHAVDRVRASDPHGTIVVRDLAQTPVPYFDGATAGALFTPPESRSDAQRGIAALSDELVEEIFAADRIVLAAPVYNFAIPAQLKSYLDHIARAGVTFRYTEAGVPEGLITGKQVIVIISRGGVAKGTAMDSTTPYLQTFLGFLGMTDLTFVAAEGVKMGEEALNAALSQARSHIDTLLAA